MLDPEIDLTTDGLLTRSDIVDRQRSWLDDSDPREIFFPKKRPHNLKKTVVVDPNGLPQISLSEDDGTITLSELLGEDAKAFQREDEDERYANALDHVLGIPSHADDVYVSEGGNKCDRCGRIVRPWDRTEGDYPLCGECERQMKEQDAQANLISEITNVPHMVEVNLDIFR